MRDGSLSKGIYKVANDKVFAREVAEAEAGPLGEEGSRTVGPATFHGHDCHGMNGRSFGNRME